MGGLLVVGLTGGISSGKSTVSKELQRNGCQVIDFDKLSREVNKKGTQCYKSLVQEFGEEILDKDGEIERKKLGEIVFPDKTKLRKLNGITHKHIAILFAKELLWHFLTGTRYLVLDSPLLIETGLHRICHFTVLVSVPEDVQLERLIARDEMEEEHAKARIASQMKAEDKKRYANYVLDNSGTLEEIPAKTKTLVEAIKKKQSWISRYFLFASVAAAFYYLLF
eukprot:TRINITY_DN10012_c0_g1_i1.p1 TRINITY_DN10012_c0_g1~~TRINITY_DN10012_c0_g1_i1.p1  ORF type:complete len:224 (-),score=47.93 TRINITY_DN10012_c0_g1_i1:1-672(-)